MASNPKLLSIIFLFALFSIQIHAREFFSKIPRENNNEKQPTVKEEQQEPRFTPQTQNGYGLYGPETNTKGTYEPYVTPVKFHPDEPYSMIPESTNNNNKDGYFHSKSAVESTQKKNLGEARFTEKGWSTEQNQNNNNHNYYNGNNGEKQGMSDTRFLENGKYFHDIRNENNYYPNQLENSRGFASRNEFNENRYNMGRYNQNQEEFEENEEEFEP
ncbi:protein E6-like isoform X3 [Hibiscus syriacus]|uniref:protein E6-like isoform X2 n=1 Tax=Hibiscus syriacus TaxID=106335 RepID=UPI0019226CF6|nr:protein E6-like isoform X2 [Hibiscus syriacus]XP_039008919.1 protein E6-like isoform X3 [Hibiscus syriacus]